MQILVLLQDNHISVGGRKLPDPYGRFLDSMSFLSFDLISFLPFGCIMRVDHFTAMLAYTITPIVMLCGILAYKQISKAIKKRAISTSKNTNSGVINSGEPDASQGGDDGNVDGNGGGTNCELTVNAGFDGGSREKDDIGDEGESDEVEGGGNEREGDAHRKKKPILSTYIYIIVLMLPTISRRICMSFRCFEFTEGVDDYGYAVADMSISCHTLRYRAMRAYALIMIAVYVMGVPLCLFFMLFQHRHLLNPPVELGQTEDSIIAARRTYFKTHSHPIMSFAMLYRPRYWWFEVYTIMRRLTLTCGVLVCNNLSQTVRASTRRRVRAYVTRGRTTKRSLALR